MNLCMFYIGFLENGVVDLIGGLVDFHSQTVDPKELTVSATFFANLVTEQILEKCPHTRLHIVMTQYTSEKTRLQAGGPSVSQFIDPPVITALCKKPDTLKFLEEKIREIKGTYLALLEQGLSPSLARLDIQVFVDLILRCLFNKPWPQVEPKLNLPVGKFSVEKIEDLATHWAKLVDLKHPGLNFAETPGLQQSTKTHEETKEVDLGGLIELKRSSSEGTDPVDMGPMVTRGDEVTVVRRMSWALPQKGQPTFRKDIVEGTTWGHRGMG